MNTETKLPELLSGRQSERENTDGKPRLNNRSFFTINQMTTNPTRGSLRQPWAAKGGCSKNIRVGKIAIPPGPAVVLFFPIILLIVVLKSIAKP